ncbi:transposase [Actinokineospora auranticolor]|uniref:transposase n=1 Tax=Actinokineospora auranticolor TaxID=155976 RepID=UPI000CEC7C28
MIRRLPEQRGVHHEALRNWIRQDQASRCERDDRPIAAESDELRRLRKEQKPPPQGSAVTCSCVVASGGVEMILVWVVGGGVESSGDWSLGSGDRRSGGRGGPGLAGAASGSAAIPDATQVRVRRPKGEHRRSGPVRLGQEQRRTPSRPRS